MKEKEWMKTVMLEVSSWKDYIIFRVNVGMAWTSSEKPIKHANGDVLLRKARPFRTGLPSGFHDLLGIKRTLITQEMVGKEIGQFFTIETKSKTGKVRTDQVAFKNAITNHGGISVISRPGENINGYFEDEQ